MKEKGKIVSIHAWRAKYVSNFFFYLYCERKCLFVCFLLS